MKKVLFYVSFFLVCLVAYLFFLFRDQENIVSNPKALSHIEPFAFMDQDGKKITEQSISNKVVVVNYFFTTCQGICPSMNNNMKKIAEKFKDSDDILFLSHTVQPEVDSILLLKDYANLYAENIPNWKFVTGNKLELYHMARSVYKIDDPNNNVGDIKDQFLHTQFFSLVNKQGYIKGVYDGLNEDDLKKLKKDIRLYLNF